ncbi:uncharacterized protein Z520_06553 [Fonsecaea multimorphosa CBS 102226]|uniref:Uncharacterized protein n=1 Tax=Fonsecaea multimorphosa CBS 102226 TaxID=1442371 RepID=A0A0D2H7F0_9EURO|nr:uncharacterized protein Z520_06553 [Fonsecaea multimorphosa CBS 102226]KIX97775.1 hypothetical protein Z520_06553 [Fonsecaea multimorphosa CBS 102226]OAL23795.1 hypothetical protein AYO22_06114 [Fonsecaea multimorphosa]
MAIRIPLAAAVIFTVMLQVTALPRRILPSDTTDTALGGGDHLQNTTVDLLPWVCPNPDAELDPIECPEGTKGGIPKPKNLQPVMVGCHNLPCPKDWVYYDAGMPKFEHTCPRHAVVANAHWRKYCRLQPPAYIMPNPWCSTGDQPWDKAMDGPSVERCCGEWVSINDPYYKEYPTVPVIVNGTYDGFVENKFEDGEEMRKVIKPSAWEFNIENPFCKSWMAEDEAQFQYFMQNLASWDVDDADLEGHGGPRFNMVWDLDSAWGHLPP